jgi:hypothetical protein
MLTSVCGYNERNLSRTCSACHIARALSREAITNFAGFCRDFWFMFLKFVAWIFYTFVKLSGAF